MRAAAALPDNDELWRPWADLPLDLLRDISRRLHATTDYVRFHATCKPWRDTVLPAPCQPAFLPWLLTPPDSTNHRTARCVFSSSKSTRRGTGAATEIWIRVQGWVISLVDGTAVSTLSNIFSGSCDTLPVPQFSSDQETKWWVDHATVVVSGDGTIFIYLIGPVRISWLWPFNAAILRPGDAEWTMVHRKYDRVSSIDSCIAHHDGKIVILRNKGHSSSSCIETRQVEWWEDWVSDTPLPPEYGKALQASYLLESRGELLLVNVLASYDHCFSYTMASFVDGLSVSVHVLQQAEGGETQWVKRDSRSLADRVVFLGRPISFAVDDAAQFGLTSGGCAYFVIKSELYGTIWSKSAIKRCRVFMYSFQEDRSELVEQLPAEWDDDACMWLTPPQPPIASIDEIRERFETSPTKAAGSGEPRFGPYFRIYVGNLPRKVDSYRLGQFVSKYGKVAEARVTCHIKTKRSRGFGFVTLATVAGHEQEHVIAKLDGQILEGRPMRVKFADQNQPHVAC